MGEQTVVTIRNERFNPVEEFRIGDDWEIFYKRLEQQFEVQEVAEGKKVPILLTCVDREVYKIIRNLCNPIKPKDKKFEELVELLNAQFQPRVPVHRRRREFDSLRQTDENISDWHVKVKIVASKCEFGNILNERVKDKFIFAMKLGPIYDRVAEKSLNKPLNELLEVALRKEAVLRERKEECVDKIDQVKRARTEEPQNLARPTNQLCFSCAKGNHTFRHCKFRNYICIICKRKGHIAAACPGKTSKSHYLEQDPESGEESAENEILWITSDCNLVDPIMVNVKVNKIRLSMQVDTGSGVSCIPFSIYKKHLASVKLETNIVKLRTYSGQLIIPVGEISPMIEINGRNKQGKLLVVKEATRMLVGRDLLKDFNVTINGAGVVEVNNLGQSTVEKLLEKHSNLFKEELGEFNGHKVKLETHEQVTPIFHKPRQIPFAFREKVFKELNHLEKIGVIEKVANSKFGTPLVPVMKANGKDIRLCANYKITINKYLKDGNHPLSWIEEIFAALQGGQQFTKLDLLSAYNQLVVDEETSELLAWSTPYGIYKVKRLPYGTKPACAIFQNIIEKVLQGSKRTVAFLDDIVVTGETREEHLKNLAEVLNKLESAGFRLNKSKCNFFCDTIKYLGHKISAVGLEKDSGMIKAIVDKPTPGNIKEVRAFIGMVNYYSRFIANLSIKLKPLYRLCEKNAQFKWTTDCDEAFKWAKEEIASDRVLVHYDPTLLLRLTCDSSAKGIGAVLSHIMLDRTERPICFVSRVLSRAEQNYAMIQKEALSIVWAVKKFFQYLAGRKFEIMNDHKPLEALFGENRSLPQMAAGRLQRWSLFLANYDYSFKFIKGKENVQADCLSRLPLPNSRKKEVENEYDYLDFMENIVPIDLNRIRSATRKDAELGAIFNYIRTGFPNKSDNELLKGYFLRKSELSIEKNVIMWGYRVLVLKCLRLQLLNELHNTHAGVSKMKANARSYFWWPSLDTDIEKWVNSCKVCLLLRPEPVKAKLMPTVKETY